MKRGSNCHLQYNHKNGKHFGKVKIINAPEGFKLMKFVVNDLNHCATMLGNNFGHEKNY